MLGGLANFYQHESNRASFKFNLSRSLLTGLVAASTVPLFLQMVSSNLLADATKNSLNYFIFGGFCLIAAYFSKRFLETISDKVIRDLQERTSKIEEETLENSEKVEVLIDKSLEGESVLESTHDKEVETIKNQVNDSQLNSIIDAFKSSQYNFKTLHGLSKDIGFDINKTRKLTNELSQQNIIKSHKRKDGSTIYSMNYRGHNL